MVSIMKIDDDAALNSYLVENLQPLTEADPNILAKYVCALLKNNKPKIELQAFCTEKLVDFLREDSKTFVVNLFHALENGFISTNQEEHDIKAADDPTSTVQAPLAAKVALTGDNTEPRTASQLQKHPDANSSGITDHDEEGSDDEDDDRNHKHRRRVQRSRSLDRDTDDGPLRKRIRPAIVNPPDYDNNNPIDEANKGPGNVEKDGMPKRRPGRDYLAGAPSRLGMDANQRGGQRGVSLLRNDILGPRFEHQNGLTRGVLGRGRGGGPLLLGARDQRAAHLDSSDLNLPMLPPGLSKNLYTGRSSSSRGNSSHSPWTGYNRFTGVTNGNLDPALPLNTGMQGSRGAPISAALGVGMNIGMGMALGRPRCPDFEERGYCLRGDLCPMEHGANRIVVEDVQSLSKFNLPVTLPSGRGIALGTVPVSSSTLAPYSSSLGLPSVVIREPNMPSLADANFSKATSGTSASTEPDLYDPDQPLWNKEQPAALVDGIRRLPSFRKDSELENAPLERSRRQSPAEEEGYERSSSMNVKPQGLSSGQSVWSRIGRTDQSDVKDGSISLFNDPPVESPQFLKVPKRELAEPHEPQNPAGKWKSDLDERAARIARGTSGKGGMSSITEGEAVLHPVGYSSLGGRSLRPPTERAQRTLYVGCIPSSPNRKELLIAHFQKFGEIVDIRVPSHGDRAFVQFLRHEDAESALTSPDAVMGNRFIRLSWAKRDSVPISSVEGPMILPSIGHSKDAVPGGAQGLVAETSAAIMKGKKQVVAVSAAFETSKNKQAAKSCSAQPSSLAVTQKKQEELEHMKEELRKKQEELAHKRDEFRRKLERLSKQGNGTASELENDRLTTSSKQELKQDKALNKEILAEKQETAHKQASLGHVAVEKVSSFADQAASGPVKDLSKQPLGSGQLSSGNLSQPSPKGLKSHSAWPSPGFSGSSLWTPLRYKLDNRTTVFRVLPPLPDSLLDVMVLKQHFQYFGDVANVEIEALDRKSEANHTEKHSAKVTFCTRSAAEKAYAHGRWYQGASLNFSWVNPPPSTSAGITSIDRAHMEGINDTSRLSSTEKGLEDGQSSKIQTSSAGGCPAKEGESEMEGQLKQNHASTHETTGEDNDKSEGHIDG